MKINLINLHLLFTFALLMWEGREGSHVHAEAGTTARGIVQAPDKPGVYTTFCSLPGHREAGMAGQLIVMDSKIGN